MRIAVSATGPSLDAEVEPRFGRCPYFVIVDPDTMHFETLDNSSAKAAGGAGISAGQMIASKGVQVVLAGNCGPNAYQVLSAAGVQIIAGVSGKIRDAIQAYKSGQLQAVSQPSVVSHFGMGRGTGCGRGAGMMPGAQEMEALKAQLQALTQQLSDIQRRIEDLEKKER